MDRTQRKREEECTLFEGWNDTQARGTHERVEDERPESSSSRCANPHTPSFLYVNVHVILSWPSTVHWPVVKRESARESTQRVRESAGNVTDKNQT